MAQSDTSTGDGGAPLAPGIAPEDFDVSRRGDVAKLRKHAVGLGGVLFLTVTGSAPISAMLFNTPTMIGVLNSMAEIGADPVTVKNSTPPSPTACLRSLATSLRWETSKSSGVTPVRAPSPPPSTDTSDCAMVPPLDGARREEADPAQGYWSGTCGCGARHIADSISW